MVDLEVLKLYGVSAEGLKKKLNVAKEKRSDKIKLLMDRIRARVQAGRDLNIERYQVHYALDQAWDSAFNQITPTLLSSLVDKELSRDEVENTLKQWGMDPNEVIKQMPDAKSQGTNTVKIDAPAFFRIFVPLVAAYVKIRWAKIINDRRMVPLLKYDPVISDEISRMKCDVLTARIEAMSRQYGYFDTMKQAVFRMLHYSECLQFPVEEWHTECALVEKGAPQKEQEMVKAPDGTEVKKIITKEGLRYHLPHPTRTYYDRAHWASSFNTDTGCAFGGFWQVLRWADVMRTEGYYNLEAIGYDDFNAWFNGRRGHSYWKNVLSGCAMNFPDSKTAEGAGGTLDNEKHIAGWYSADMADRPIVVTTHYEKLVPKDNDLGDYPYPVWIRFVVAADNEIIYAAPVPYCPIVWYGYDYAEGRTHNASMSLEVLPFQDQFTNLLTQLLLTTRQNLANITFIDSDVVDHPWIDKLRNLGERMYRSINIAPMSFKAKFQKQQANPRDAIIAHKLPLGDTNSIMMSMKVVLDTLERVLVMSAQEVGQSASHEQTREEVRHIAQNTSTRVTFTSIGVDTARDAWKRQLYYALMAYGQDEFWAEVPMDQPMDQKTLEALGFTVAGPYNEKNRRQYLKVNNKTAIAYESFSSDRDGEDRVNDTQTAEAMIMLFDKAMNNPQIAPAIGPDQAIAILNQIAKYLGFPRDFKLVNTGQQQTMQDQIGEALQQLKAMFEEQLGGVTEDITGALKEITSKNVEQDEVLKKVVSKLNLILGEANAIDAPSLPSPNDMDAPMTLPATEQDMMIATGGV